MIKVWATSNRNIHFRNVPQVRQLRVRLAHEGSGNVLNAVALDRVVQPTIVAAVQQVPALVAACQAARECLDAECGSTDRDHVDALEQLSEVLAQAKNQWPELFERSM